MTTGMHLDQHHSSTEQPPPPKNEEYRAIAVVLGTAVIAFNGFVPCIAGFKPLLINVPFLLLATALLFAAVTAQEKQQPILFWLFFSASLIVSTGI